MKCDNLGKHLTGNPLYRKVLDRFHADMLSVAALAGPGSILDVGCGEGFATVLLAKRFPKAGITAVDLKKQHIEYAKNHNSAANIEYRVGNVLRLKENRHDLVVSLEVLEHIPDYRLALRALVSASKKYVLVSVPNEPWFRLANILRLRHLKSLGNPPEHVNHWSAGSFKKLVRSLGRLRKFKTSTFWNIALIQVPK